MCVSCSLNCILYRSVLCGHWTQWVAMLSVPHLPPPKKSLPIKGFLRGLGLSLTCVTCTITTCGAEADLGGGCRGCTPPPPWDDLRFSNTTDILQKKKTMWFIGVEVEQETSAPPPKKKKNWIRPCGECDNKIWPRLFKRWIALSTE